MKNLRIFLFGLFSLTLIVSCTKESNDVSVEKKSLVDFEKTKVESDIGWISYKGGTIVSNRNTLTCFDGDDIFTHLVSDTNNMQIDIETTVNGFVLVNSLHQNEKVYVTKISEINSVIIYNIVGSNGIRLDNVKYFNKVDSTISVECPVCVVVIGAALINALFPPESPCVAAAKECRLGGGLPSTKIEEHWYGGTSCEVTCNPKP